MTERVLSYIQYTLFFSLFFIMKSFTPQQEIHQWEKLVPANKSADMTAKP